MTVTEMDALRQRVVTTAEHGTYESYKTQALWSCDRGAADQRYGKLEHS